MEILQGVWKQHLRPRAVVGYGVKIFLPSPPNYVTRSPGKICLRIVLIANYVNVQMAHCQQKFTHQRFKTQKPMVNSGPFFKQSLCIRLKPAPTAS